MFEHLCLRCVPDSKTVNSIEVLKEKAVLGKLHTKQLLNLKHRYYAIYQGANWNTEKEDVTLEINGVHIRWSLFKQELDSREHIYTKKELQQQKRGNNAKPRIR